MADSDNQRALQGLLQSRAIDAFQAVDFAVDTAIFLPLNPA